jgi:glycosyltransferase involved in cell wall biosynthesis
MACGLPVVASDIPGNRDVVRHGYSGLLFTMNDPDALAACLLDLIHRPDLRRQLGAAARRTIEQSFSMDTVAGQYISLYRDLLAAPAASQTRPVEVEYEPFRPYQLAGEKEEHIP